MYDAIAIFVEVAEKRSFIGAAESLGMAKTTVSRKLAELESHLGVQLLYRTTRQVSLTELGEHYLAECQPAIHRLKQANAEIKQTRDKPKGRLRIAASFVIGKSWLPPILNRFKQQYPEIQVELMLENKFIDMISEDIDLALRVGPLQDSSFRARVLTEFEYFICAAPDYLQSRGTPVVPQDLQHHNCLITSSSRQSSAWTFLTDKGKTLQVPVQGDFRANHFTLCQDMARQGHGITLLPDFLAEADIQSKKLVQVLKDWRCQPRSLYGVYAPQRYLVQTVHLFLDTIKNPLSS